MRRPLLQAISLSLLLCSLPAAAVEMSAQELQLMRDDAYHATTQLFMYAILEKARERRDGMTRLVAGLDSRITGLGDGGVQARWQALRSALLGDPYLNNEVNQLALYAAEDRTAEFAGELERHMPRAQEPRQRTIYALVAHMQVMMAIYLRNAADPLGGANYSGVDRSYDLAKMSQEFSAQLDELARSQPGLAAAVLKLRPKWAFLSPRFSDYNQKTVPYLVDLYGRQIIDTLLSAAAG